MEKCESGDRLVGVIVAHPDDETLWTGGTLLMHPLWQCHIITMCRASDPDRSVRFTQTLAALHATGAMGDLDDGVDQRPLALADLQQTILPLLKTHEYDCLLTHSPRGEYTRHRRHEETFAAVADLWRTGRVSARHLWTFAYQDDGGRRLPYAREDAHYSVELPERIWDEKYRIIRDIYGFTADSWEARTTPRVEAFYGFSSPEALAQWQRKEAEQ